MCFSSVSVNFPRIFNHPIDCCYVNQTTLYNDGDMNPLIVTIIIALGTFIISIFGASWLNQQAMNKRIDDLKTYLAARFAGLEQSVNARFDGIDVRLDAVDQRITRLKQRVERIERQLDAVFKPSLPRA
jgi:hypothetical protein